MPKILIAAHYNMNNGDRAVLEATIRKLLEYDNNIKITVSAINPHKLIDQRIQVVGWPIKNIKLYKTLFWTLMKFNNFRLLKKIYKVLIDSEYMKALCESDIVLISGGHHLTDILGSRNYYNLAINYLIPIFESKKVYLMPQSIGPVNNTRMRYTTKFILDHVQSIAYRDNSSKIFLKELNVKVPFKYVPDIVFSLSSSQEKINKKEIGIALYCSYVGDKQKKLFPIVIKNLIDVIITYALKGYQFTIISMDINDIQYAKKIIKECNARLKRDCIKLEKPKSNNISDVISLFSNKEMILAYKTHSVIFSLVNAVPVVAIAYHSKSIEFMEAVNLDTYTLRDINASKKNLSVLINEILADRENIIQLEQTGVKKNIELIDYYITDILNPFYKSEERIN